MTKTTEHKSTNFYFPLVGEVGGKSICHIKFDTADIGSNDATVGRCEVFNRRSNPICDKVATDKAGTLAFSILNQTMTSTAYVRQFKGPKKNNNSGDSYDLTNALACFDSLLHDKAHKQRLDFLSFDDNFHVYATGEIADTGVMKNVCGLNEKLINIKAHITHETIPPEKVFVCVTQASIDAEEEKDKNSIQKAINNLKLAGVRFIGTSSSENNELFFNIAEQLYSEIYGKENIDSIINPDYQPFPGLNAWSYNQRGFYKTFDCEPTYNYIQKVEDAWVKPEGFIYQCPIIVSGPTGAGKSSFISASIVPRIEKAHWEGGESFAFSIISVRSLLSEKEKDLISVIGLIQENIANDLKLVETGKESNSQEVAHCICLDQFESFFNLIDLNNFDEEKQALTNFIAQLYKNYPKLHFLIGCRHEFKSYVNAIVNGIGERSLENYTNKLIDDVEYIDIDSKVNNTDYWKGLFAKLTQGFNFEGNLKERIEFDFCAVQSLPAISFFFLKLFEAAQTTKDKAHPHELYITQDIYDTLAGFDKKNTNACDYEEEQRRRSAIEHCLITSADEILEDFFSEQQFTLESSQGKLLLYQFFYLLVHTVKYDVGGAEILIAKPAQAFHLHQAGPDLKKLLEHFVDKHIVKKVKIASQEPNEDQYGYELLHESLIKWPRVTAWHTKWGELKEWCIANEQFADNWEQEQSKTTKRNSLLKGNQLEVASFYLNKYSELLSPAVISFVSASIKSDKKSKKIKRYKNILYILLVPVVIFIAIFVFQREKIIVLDRNNDLAQIELAQQQANIAGLKQEQAEKLTEQKSSDEKHCRALLYQLKAVESEGKGYKEQARHAAILALANAGPNSKMEGAKKVLSKLGLKSSLLDSNRKKFFAADGVLSVENNVIAAARFDNTIALYDSKLKLISELEGHQSSIIQLVLHPTKSALLLSIDTSGELRQWDLTRGSNIIIANVGRQVSQKPIIKINGNSLTLFTNEVTYKWLLSSTKPKLITELETPKVSYFTASSDGKYWLGNDGGGQYVVYNSKLKKVIYQFTPDEPLTSNIVFAGGEQLAYAIKEQLIFEDFESSNRTVLKCPNKRKNWEVCDESNIVKLKPGKVKGSVIWFDEKNDFGSTNVASRESKFLVNLHSIPVSDFIIDGESLYTINDSGAAFVHQISSPDKSKNSSYSYQKKVVSKSPNQKYLAVAKGGSDVEAWDLTNGHFYTLPGKKGTDVYRVTATNNGVVVMYRSRAIVHWDFLAHKVDEIPLEKLPKAFGRHSFSPDGQYYVIFESATNKIHITNLHSWKYDVYSAEELSFDGDVIDKTVSFSKNEQYMAFQATDKSWYQYSFSNKKMNKLFSPGKNVSLVTYSYDADLMAINYQDNESSYLAVVKDEEFLVKKELPNRATVRSNSPIEFSAKNNYLIGSFNHGGLLKWDIKNNRLIEHTLKGHAYFSLLPRSMIVAIDREHISMHKFDDSPIEQDYRGRPYNQGLRYGQTLMHQPSSVDENQLNTFQGRTVLEVLTYRGSRKYKLKQMLFAGSKQLIPVIENVALKQSVEIDTGPLKGEELKQVVVTYNGKHAFLLYEKGYVVYSYETKNTKYYKDKRMLDSYFATEGNILTSIDDQYIILATPGTSSRFVIVDLFSPEKLIYPGGKTIISGSKIALSYYQQKLAILHKYPKGKEKPKSTIFLKSLETGNTELLEIEENIQRAWLSKDGNYLQTKQSTGESDPIYLKTYFMNKQQWKQLAAEYQARSNKHFQGDELEYKLKTMRTVDFKPLNLPTLVPHY
ncbi:nSTAND1 domain-containing NTPase [Colwellia sp. Bg11-28]|uniref:nSTAND1 domain-containing NTPase n=1 Tax=Colwellia sp. Bg11-28 TaxID=2058305 RepID=UPI000C328517|nr:WD40 repeat domain-containing protein [Colwellia sp. Bg11-28]PKH87907.1 hypothetical protein CXF79_14920 [Colwellia sp. Bg11-28]